MKWVDCHSKLVGLHCPLGVCGYTATEDLALCGLQ